MELEEQLDLVFEIIKEGKIKGYENIAKSLNIDSTTAFQLINRIKKEGLIANDWSTLTLEGKRFEGFAKRKKNIEDKELLGSNKMTLEIDALKSQIKANRFNKGLSIISMIISFIALLVAIFHK